MASELNAVPQAPQNLEIETDGSSSSDTVVQRIHEVTSYVETLVASWNGPTTFVERRRWHRIPYHRNILVTPLDDEKNEPAGPSMLFQGRDISLGGVSFAHKEPLSCRRVACTFDATSGCRESVIVRLTWCRFTKEGMYQSGGQFVQAISLDVDPTSFAPKSDESDS